MLLSAFFLVFSTAVSTASAKPTAIFMPGDHCVAWKARKVMALVKSVEPVGRNCEIVTEFRKLEDGTYQFWGSFPTEKFDSREPDRDKEVAKMLKAHAFPNLFFESKPMTLDEWRKALKEGQAEIQGQFFAAGHSVAITPSLRIEKNGEKYVFTGQFITDYTTFKLEPPSVGGGLIAKAKNYLEFHFSFQADRLKGFEVLATPKDAQ